MVHRSRRLQHRQTWLRWGHARGEIPEAEWCAEARLSLDQDKLWRSDADALEAAEVRRGARLDHLRAPPAAGRHMGRVTTRNTVQ